MSLLYKCDRCADVFAPPTDLTPDEEATPENMEDRELYYRVYRAGGKDLCKNCIGELLEWMDLKK